MAIQKINLGTEPLGEGGDTYRSANTKINENFSNTTHAASRLVGTASGNVPEMRGSGVGGGGYLAVMPPNITPEAVDAESLATGFYTVRDNPDNTAVSFTSLINVGYSGATNHKGQLLFGFRRDVPILKVRTMQGTWSPVATVYHSLNTTKDSKTNLLLASGNELPEDFAASKKVGGGLDALSTNSNVRYNMEHGNAYEQAPEGADLNGNMGFSSALSSGGRKFTSDTTANTPEGISGGLWFLDRYSHNYLTATSAQVIRSYDMSEGWIRKSGYNYNYGASTWKPLGSNTAIYKTTTASNANVYVGTDGTLSRSTSSMKYKDLISKLELDDTSYQKAIAVKPIVYRSKAELDPKNWHFLSFSAEELGGYDPALTQWKTHETVVDEETGESISVELEEREAEGINLNAICAVLHATNIYQDKKIKELEKRLTALETGNEPEPVEELIEEEVEDPEVVDEPSKESK